MRISFNWCTVTRTWFLFVCKYHLSLTPSPSSYNFLSSPTSVCKNIEGNIKPDPIQYIKHTVDIAPTWAGWSNWAPHFYIITHWDSPKHMGGFFCASPNHDWIALLKLRTDIAQVYANHEARGVILKNCTFHADVRLPPVRNLNVNHSIDTLRLSITHTKIPLHEL